VADCNRDTEIKTKYFNAAGANAPAIFYFKEGVKDSSDGKK